MTPYVFRNSEERVTIHLEYHHLVATTHEATGRCRSWSGQLEIEGVNSSLALAVAASRSTPVYLRAIVHILVDDFVAELARLVNRAVLKARQEQGLGGT